jgi:hypothetical protein
MQLLESYPKYYLHEKLYGPRFHLLLDWIKTNLLTFWKTFWCNCIFVKIRTTRSTVILWTWITRFAWWITNQGNQNFKKIIVVSELTTAIRKIYFSKKSIKNRKKNFRYIRYLKKIIKINFFNKIFKIS